MPASVYVCMPVSNPVDGSKLPVVSLESPSPQSIEKFVESLENEPRISEKLWPSTRWVNSYAPMSQAVPWGLATSR